MTNQLRFDLERRIDEKLHKWLTDSCELYGMAKLSQGEAIQDIITVLMFRAITSALAVNISKESIKASVDLISDRMETAEGSSQ